MTPAMAFLLAAVGFAILVVWAAERARRRIQKFYDSLGMDP